MIQPLTHGLGRNVRTLISFDTVLKKTISKEVARDIRLAMLALIVTRMCHMVTRLGHNDHWVDSYHVSPLVYILRHFRVDMI